MSNDPNYPQYPQPGNNPQFPQYPGYGQPPSKPEPPNSILTAVKLMYAGAALGAVNAVIALATISAIKTAIEQRSPNLTASQVSTAESIVVGAVVVGGLIGVALWLWMAWANRAGRSWARIVATVFFALSTLGLLRSLSAASTSLLNILGVAEWLVGLGAIIFMYQKPSSDYYTAASFRG